MGKVTWTYFGPRINHKMTLVVVSSATGERIGSSSTDKANIHREPPNEVFADLQFHPEVTGRGRDDAELEMVIRAMITPEYAPLASISCAAAKLVGDRELETNSSAVASAEVVNPEEKIDVGVTDGTVTVIYKLRISKPKLLTPYLYNVVFFSVSEGELKSFGVYDFPAFEIQCEPRPFYSWWFLQLTKRRKRYWFLTPLHSR